MSEYSLSLLKLEKTNLCIGFLTYIDFAERVSSRAVCISSRVVYVFCGTFFLMVFHGNGMQGHRGHMMKNNIFLREGRGLGDFIQVLFSVVKKTLAQAVARPKKIIHTA